MKTPRIAAETAAGFLRGRGWPIASRLAPVEHGEWSRAFRFAVANGSEYVVRFSRLDADFRKDQRAARYATAELPIPRVLEIGAAFDGFYAISERVRGAFLDSLDAEQLAVALPSMWDAINAMRQSDISGTDGFGVWDAHEQAPHASWTQALLAVGIDGPHLRTAGWRSRLEASPTGAKPFDQALARLVELSADAPNARYLVHADLLNYNVLVDGQRVSAVLDWGAAMYGDWLFDVAWFVFWQPWYPAWSGIDFASSAVGHFRRSSADLSGFGMRMRCCEIAIGLDNQAYCAFIGESRWAQLEQVARRTLDVSAHQG